MKRTNGEKGITLIALIITIIVLLILAVVTIRAVSGDGIINYAKNARNEYELAQENEQAMLDSYISRLEAELGSGATEGEGGSGNEQEPTPDPEPQPDPEPEQPVIHTWTQDRTTLTNEAGDTLTVGSVVTDGTTQFYIFGAKDGKIQLFRHSTTVQTLSGSLSASSFRPTNYSKDYLVSGSARVVTLDDIDKITGFNKSSITTLGQALTATRSADGNTLTYTLKKDGTTLKTGEINCENSNWFLTNEGSELAAGKTATVTNSGYEYKLSDYINTSSPAYTMLYKEPDMEGGSYDAGYWIATDYYSFNLVENHPAFGTYLEESFLGCCYVSGNTVGCKSWVSSQWGTDTGSNMTGYHAYGPGTIVTLKEDAILTPSGTNSYTVTANNAN